MKIYLEKTNEYKDVEASTVKELLAKLKINPTTVIVIKNNELVSEDDKVSNKDEIKLLSVISGG
ncbi:MoaD/ThiS family protein [Candidatus Woesearchaeota archaeon]|nr:MoaD/ThiS family protein [Candidatus Woesearchaeota archaeon]